MIIIKDKENTSLIHLSNNTNVDDYIVQNSYASTIAELYRLLEELDAKIDTPSEPSEPDEPTGDVKLQNIKYAIIKKIMSTINPDKGFDGMKSVEIDGTPLYNQGVEKGYQNGREDGIDEGYATGREDGIDEQKSKLSSISISQNGTYVNNDGYNKVSVNIETNPIKIQNSKHVELTSAFQSIYPDDGFDAMKSVYVDASNVEPDRSIHFEEIGYEDGFIKQIYGDINDEIEYSKNFNFETGDKEQLIFFPYIDTTQMTSIEGLFWGCYSLKAIPKLNCMNVLDEEVRIWLDSLRYCGGFVDIKSNLDFSHCSYLDTHSVLNICHNLFNFNGNGYNGDYNYVRTIKFSRYVEERAFNTSLEEGAIIAEAQATAQAFGWDIQFV